MTERSLDVREDNAKLLNAGEFIESMAFIIQPAGELDYVVKAMRGELSIALKAVQITEEQADFIKLRFIQFWGSESSRLRSDKALRDHAAQALSPGVLPLDEGFARSIAAEESFVRQEAFLLGLTSLVIAMENNRLLKNVVPNK